MNETTKSKRRLTWGLLIVAALVLAGCAANRGMLPPIDENSTGFWDHTILYNLQRVIIAISDFFGGHYAAGIFGVTVIIRALLIPLYQYQQHSAAAMQELQPQMQALQEKYSSKDLQTQEKLQQEMSKLQKEAGYNPWLAFLPLVIQLPILAALYQAILRSRELTQGTFLWMDLGEPDPFFVLPVIAAALLWYNSHLLLVQSGNTNGVNRVMQWITPALIFLITFGLPSAIGLYLVTTNLFSVGQTLLINNPYRKRREREEEAAKQRDLERRLKKARRKYKH